MVCFSGIGGMIKVGCNWTKAALKELNSEYRRCTSNSWSEVSFYTLIDLTASSTPVCILYTM
jgi:hypothetical protein